VKPDFVPNETARMCAWVHAHERKIWMFHRAGLPSGAAELLFVRLRTRLNDLCR
jgi:hypothetical protein